ncbi:MAG: type I polyketide synthase, partial [Gemmatimonadetes bacterium]|nr:type I polyketide synthase [Gemmatimonadota bacterium]
MTDTADRAIAIVGVGAILPDAPDVDTFWSNVRAGVYSISDVSPERWDPELYYDPDPAAPDKSYSRIGGWVREAAWDPFAWRLPIPPAVSDQMDGVQRWAVSATRAALVDYGWPDRNLDAERTAVILGNAMAGERHYLTSMRIMSPEFSRALAASPGFAGLPTEQQERIAAEANDALKASLPCITEDTMPGELSNCIAGRIASLFNFRGPNYVVDAACASAMAAMSAAVEGLLEGDFDAVISGGVDRNMGPSTFVKFCKIGALSATGTRPYADGADGFVMGEGAALFILKRLADAERDGDRIHAVLRAMGGSSDGRGKGITAPNPIGQRLALQRAWANAGLSPASAGFIEGHGTSTRVGDVVEVESLSHVFGEAGAATGSIRLGSVKSNFGHLKGAAGAAGLLKATLALRDRVVPPSVNCETPNPAIDIRGNPFRVNTSLEEWDLNGHDVRRAGVSAFGFGGTNFHAVLEEHVPGRLTDARRVRVAGADFADSDAPSAPGGPGPIPAGPRTEMADRPFGLGVLIGSTSIEGLKHRLQELGERAGAGEAPPPAFPSAADLEAPERVAIDFRDAADLARKVGRALAALEGGRPGRWVALAAQGVFRGSGPAAPVAFLFTGQGSQYVGMLGDLRADEPAVAATFAEADATTAPLLGQPLSSFVFAGSDEAEVVARAEDALKQTAITQPAVLTVDTALCRLLRRHGVEPTMTMGHSLGEYGALVASGAMTFAGALEAVSARGREMTRVSLDDNGAMAAVFASPERVAELLSQIDGYVVVANINSSRQAVIGGATDAVEAAVALFNQAEIRCAPLPVSHAFHTEIVAPASEPLRRALERIDLDGARIPIVSNVTGAFYPEDRTEALDLLARQVASPVQFVKGLETLWEAGARVFVEVGPKRALTGFVQDVLGDRDEARWLFTNHPKMGDRGSFNRCLWGLYAAGHGLT